MTTLCRGCNLPPPSEWCWENKHDCWMDYPPRSVDSRKLLDLIRALQLRVDRLEERLYNDG